MYLGINAKTTELVIGNEDSIHMVRSVRRFTADQTWDYEVLEKVQMSRAEAAGVLEDGGALTVPVRASPAEPTQPRMG